MISPSQRAWPSIVCLLVLYIIAFSCLDLHRAVILEILLRILANISWLVLYTIFVDDQIYFCFQKSQVCQNGMLMSLWINFKYLSAIYTLFSKRFCLDLLQSGNTLHTVYSFFNLWVAIICSNPRWISICFEISYSILCSFRVTDGALIAETAVWPNFFLMNIFFALKESERFIIICSHCSWMLCRVAAIKVSPHSSIVQIIFYFWSFEIMEYILRARN